MFKAVIFDLGKVLISFSHEKMYASMATLMGLSPENLKMLINDHKLDKDFEKGLVSEEFVLEVLQDNSINKFTPDAMIKAFSDIFVDDLNTRSLITKLKMLGLQTAILSNTNSMHIKWLKKHYDFFNQFDALIFSYEAFALKPEKKIYQMAADALKLQPSECLFIDDLTENIEGAEKAGMRGIHFKNYEQLLLELAGCGISIA